MSTSSFVKLTIVRRYRSGGAAHEPLGRHLAGPDSLQHRRSDICTSPLLRVATPNPQITYDLDQLPQEQRLPLKDTLIANLKTTPKASRTQLCLALADLLLQLPEWQNPTQEVIQHLGNDPATVLALLEFLHVLPQEMTGNIRINITVRQTRV